MMDRTFWKLPFAVGALAFASVILASAHAQCGLPPKPIKPTVWNLDGSRPHVRAAGFFEDRESKQPPSIVGMWRVTFTAKTMNGASIPATVIDNAIVVWHEDKTEIMNSGRPPQDGNFCLGRVGTDGPPQLQAQPLRLGSEQLCSRNLGGGSRTTNRSSALSGDDSSRVRGQALLRRIHIGPGTTSGNVTTSFTGVIKATRITVDSTVRDLLRSQIPHNGTVTAGSHSGCCCCPRQRNDRLRAANDETRLCFEVCPPYAQTGLSWVPNWT